MQKVIKLDSQGLRRLVNEAIQGRQPGSPLFEAPNDEPYGIAEESIEKLLNRLADQWHTLADAGDPSIQATGEAAWEEQVMTALDDLREKLLAACEEVESKLINGEYYSG